MDPIWDYLRRTPEAALFLCLASGYALGRLRVREIQLGGICGTLIVALLVGQIGVQVDAGVKNVAFALFIFALGFSAGPQFFSNLNANSLRVGVLSIIEVIVATSLVLAATALLHLDRGTAAGLLAGAATESAVVGTAGEAIGRLPLPPDEIERLQANVATTYTITYLFGLITIVLFTTQAAPRLLGISLPDEARKLWTQYAGGDELARDQTPAMPDLVGRLYLIRKDGAIDEDGMTVDALEDAMRANITIERIRRGARDLTPFPALRLRAGDRILVVGRREALVAAAPLLGRELPAETGMELALEARRVFITRKDVDGLTVDALRALADKRVRHGVYLQALTRADRAVPLLPHTVLRRGDVVTLYGAPVDLDRATAELGYRITQTDSTDLVLLGFGIVVGMLIGSIVVPVAGVPISLGTGGGALVSGLVLGWLRARRPTSSALPPAAAMLLKDLGLATFIAVLGLSAGPHALDLIRSYGLTLPVVGVLVSLVPALVSLFVGHAVLKLAAPVLIGGIAGQQASTPAISAVLTSAGNSTPLLGYTVTYALSNVFLPLTGPLIVALAGQFGR